MHNYWADGQKIAKKLSSQINKEAKAIKELVAKYNVFQEGESPLTEEEAYNPDRVGTRLQKWVPVQSQLERKETS
jgi:hypothetical protein